MMKQHLPQRLALYCVGLFILAIGVVISIRSNMGVSPVSSLPNVINLITDINLGALVTGVMIFYIVLQILILRRDFKLIQLTQVIFSTVFGYFVDMASWLLGDFTIPTYAGSLVMCAMSIVLIAIGVSLYVDAGLVPMPMEGLTLAITEELKGKKSFHDVKVIVDSVVVVISIVLSFVFLGGLYGVREGTILAALLVGRVMKYIHKWIDPIVKKCIPSKV